MSALRPVKAWLRTLLQIDPQSRVTTLAQLEWIGSETHGYVVPQGLLDEKSICYCVGAGEDITFDTELAVRFGCRVYTIDPTPEGWNHFELVKASVRTGEPLASTNGTPFRYRISALQMQLLHFVPVGIWDTDGTMRFYEPTRPDYPSHSVTLFRESGRHIELPVRRLSRLMDQLEHRHIDLLKLEIEGAEYRVIETVLEDKLDVGAIAVEYDEVYHSHGKAHLFRIRNSASRLLRAGYRLAHSTDMFKRLFVREDVFTRLARASPSSR